MAIGILFSLFGWSFIPDFATQQILGFLYRGIPFRIVYPPQRSSIQLRKHYAVTFAFVILGYLLYTLVQSSRAMPPNFYQILNVSPDVDESGLKIAFRTFAKRFHPDRPGVGKEGETLFIFVRDAYEALKDPAIRSAYDRFGPEALVWRQTCKTTRDFLYRGLMAASGYHIAAGIALLFWGAIGQPSPVSFWRYILFASLLAGELSFILSPFPTPPSGSLPLSSFFSVLTSSTPTVNLLPSSSFPILQTIFPNRVPYQHILFLHQVFMFLSVALSRVVPHFLVLLNPVTPEANEINPEKRAILEHIFAAMSIADREASLLLHTIFNSTALSSSSSSKPYHSPTLARMQPLPDAQLRQALDELTPEIENLVIEANIKNHHAGPVASAWDACLRRCAPLVSGLSLQKKINLSAHDVLDGENLDGPSTPQSPPRTPLRPKNFWEKEVVAEDVIALSDEPLLNGSGSPARPGTPRASSSSSFKAGS